MFRHELRHAVRRKLLHVVKTCNISGETVFMLELIQSLPEYGHTVVVTSPPDTLDRSIMWPLQAAGVDLLFQPDYDSYDTSIRHNAAILYGKAAGDAKIPDKVPVIYYAYGHYDASVPCDILLSPSEFVSRRYDLPTRHHVLSPGVRGRMLRKLPKKGDNEPFTFGIFSSHANGKYPMELIRALMKRVPPDMRMLITQNNALPPPPTNKTVWMIPHALDATWRGIQLSDVVVYANSCNYETPYGRSCVEAMAARRPVVCERRGAISESVTEGDNVVMFDTPDDVLEQVKHLQRNPDLRDRLAANAQEWASRQDISLQLGALKGLLQTIGA